MIKEIIKKTDSVILITVFCFLIATPLIVSIIEEDLPVSGIEKRNLTAFPSFPISTEQLIKYPKDFNLYYSDHFGYREKLTKNYFKLVNKLGDQSSVDDVTVGLDGWLFLGSVKPGYSNYGDPFGDAINANLFRETELQRFASSLTATKNWLKNKGIEYIYVIAPNKHTIYFDKMPSFISKKNNYSATDQLVSYINKHTDVTIVDLRPVLFDAKKNQQLYFKNDTHWNHYGANIAQFEIMKHINTLLPGKITPSLLSNNEFTAQQINKGDLTAMAKINGQEEVYPTPIFNEKCLLKSDPQSISEIEKHTMTCNTESLNAVIFRDSFFSALHPYFARKFNRSTYTTDKLSYDKLVKYIDKEKPDIVIEEVVERELPYVPSGKGFIADMQ
ncbi:MAG: hypothetical protein KAT90_03570 [Gammaproteobacteria bacterium]|nr:hypothetical protein [Gammaproteobacteria bacterium]